jgi:PAS domain S-box-containing protein
MVESTMHGMVMVDAAGTILFGNRKFARQFGYEGYELLGQSIERLVPERFRSSHQHDGSTPLSFPAGVRGDIRRHVIGLRKDGSEFALTVSLSSFTTKDGAYVVTSVSEIH